MPRLFIIKLCLLIINIYRNLTVLSISTTDDVFAISTEGCTIPGFSLISEGIKDLVGPPPIVHNCSMSVPLVGSNSSHIWVIKEAYNYFNIWGDANFYCCYKNFSAENNIGNLSYGRCTQFTTYIRIKHEFVSIECYYMDNNVYNDFIFTMKNVKHVEKSEVRSPNVLILGMEGMSRMNFLRTMPKTSKYLRDKGSIQLLGYNKLGDNTFPNIFPLLMGRSFQDVKNVCMRNHVTDTDKCPFMWDRYKIAGYKTALASDSSAGLLGTYEHSLPKFPTDFYLQPFMYETRCIFRHHDYDYHMCLHNNYFYKILLNYIKDLTGMLRLGKLFGIFWEESITHEHLNLAHVMDEDYENLLRNLDDNTVIIFLSDHGMRLGKIVETEQGRIESRLPLLEVLFPTEFRHRYKLAYKNFEKNKNRLTTPYDIYETLLDLIDPTLLQDNNIKERTRALNMNARKVSLFLPIPGNRTCETVGISEHWCTCLKGKQVPARPKVKIFAARFLVAHINKLLSNFPLCHKLKIDKILDATVARNRNDRGRTYTVVVQTSPGAGIFDGTLIWERGIWVVSGTVSRHNQYRGQSRCVTDAVAKMYCYCK